jgi:hypothetical protein
LATGLCVAACRQRRRVRFTTATALINELVEAAHANQLSRALGRWERLDLICIDELGYVPLAETACELMFQVMASRSSTSFMNTRAELASRPPTVAGKFGMPWHQPRQFRSIGACLDRPAASALS